MEQVIGWHQIWFCLPNPCAVDIIQLICFGSVELWSTKLHTRPRLDHFVQTQIQMLSPRVEYRKVVQVVYGTFLFAHNVPHIFPQNCHSQNIYF